jgi:hypothetical protein
MKSTAAADVPAIVIILKKTQGSVWSEAGRTPLGPTLGWLRTNYGAGQYELQLKRGNRILCMTPALCTPELRTPELSAPKLGAITSSPLVSERRPASGTERARVGIGLRGTALG